jgi:hypothetical protein
MIVDDWTPVSIGVEVAGKMTVGVDGWVDDS